MSRINLDRRGAGSPVVLVHGIGSGWQVFEPIFDLLAAHHDVIAVDLPGFGRTPADPDVVPSAVRRPARHPLRGARHRATARRR